MNVIYRPRFWFDLEDGVAYLKRRASVEVAVQWHAEIMATVARIVKQPDLGRLRKDLRQPGIRSLVIRKYPRYLLFYSWEGDSLEILRIKHGMMDIPKLF